MTFQEFMKEVDHHLLSIVGMTHLDFDDYSYYDAYDAGVSAAETADLALENAGYEG